WPKLQPGGLLAMIGIEVRKRCVVGSHDGCSSDRPAPAGMIVGSTVILAVFLTWLCGASPLGSNSVADGGGARRCGGRRGGSVVSAISWTRVVPPVEIVCLRALSFGASRSNTFRVLSPSPP